MENINYRQVHMDFHTSQYITEVGKDFKAEEFAEELKQAHVDSVTCFARCHHGWLYYPSKKNPELIHPNLDNKNILLEQIEECHKRGIRVPVYTTVRWDNRIIREHPEWLCRDENGYLINKGNVPEPHFYFDICMNSGYRKFFKEHLEDIIEVVGEQNLDGIFMDIVTQTECCCDNCKKLMKKEGLDPQSREDRIHFSELTLNRFRSEMAELIRNRVPDATIFYNDSGINPVMRKSVESYSHLELESLPSGDWGYDHFPIMARYASHFGCKMIGMTGKFHTSWGDFHSLKNEAALAFECYQMLALGAGCSVGDQLHPWGKLSKGTYQLIGKIYQEVEKKEVYCKNARPESEIAILSPHAYSNPVLEGTKLPESLIGAVHLLQELAYQFTIIDESDDFEDYSLLILPDDIPYSKNLERKIEKYLKQGGSIFGSYKSCINSQSMSSELYGIGEIVESDYSREFVVPNSVIGKSLPQEPFVMYEQGMEIKSLAAKYEHIKVLMEKTEPWFERGNEGCQFCSHQHAPTPEKVMKIEMLQNRKVIYCTHPIFKCYRKNAPVWCKEMLKDALSMLLPHKMVSHNGPSTLLCVLNQRDENTKVLHVLHYIPEKRSEEIYTIEDVIPLYHTEFCIYLGNRKLDQIKLVPEESSVAYKEEEEYVIFTLEKLNGHQMIELKLKNEN